MLYIVDDGALYFSGEPAEVLALYGILCLSKFEHDAELDRENWELMLNIYPAAQDHVLSVLAEELEGTGLTLDQDTWGGAECIEDDLYPSEHGDGRSVFYVPLFHSAFMGTQLELELA